jgi:hypothetical protein
VRQLRAVGARPEPSVLSIGASEILVLTLAPPLCHGVCTIPRRRAMNPNPTALTTLVKPDDVEKHRALSCSEYDGCLDAASRREWRSWTCVRCKLFAFARAMRATEAARFACLRPPG